MLEMRTVCESCHIALDQTDLVYICSFECTFCETCAREMACVCPNCSGELVKRPTRVREAADVTR